MQGCRKWLLRLLAVMAVLGLLITGVFLRWRQAELQRIECETTVIETAVGPIEYTEFGSGPAVVLLHGTINGYDGALPLGQMLDTVDYRFIAISRPGYLRTPLSSGNTFAGQAAAIAALLDELGIEQAAVMGISGGGPPAFQFAMDYPERTWGMVLIAASTDAQVQRDVNATTDSSGGPPQWLTSLVLSDFASWVITGMGENMPARGIGLLVGEDYVDDVLNDDFKFALYQQVLESFKLLGMRRDGSFNDGTEFSKYTGLDYSRVETPTLMMVGTEDDAGLIAQHKALEERLLNAESHYIEGGTHFMPISHDDELRPLILDFFAEHAPEE